MNMLTFVFHKHIGYVQIALVESIVDGLDVVKAVCVHVATAFAQRVHDFRMVGTHSQHQRCVAVVIFGLEFCAVVE